MTTRPKPVAALSKRRLSLFDRRGSSIQQRQQQQQQRPGGSNAAPPFESAEVNDGYLPSHNYSEKTDSSKNVAQGTRRLSESGRSGFHPVKFLQICWKSNCTLAKWVNVLWPFVPAAIVLHFARPSLHRWIFALNYIAMVPAANLLGFAGQEFGQKMPRVVGAIVETTLGSVVEIVLFTVLIVSSNGPVGGEGNNIHVVQSAILGSILANLLFALGMCLFAGGLGRKEQAFHESVSEVGTGLLLIAGFGLIIPAAYSVSLSDPNASPSQQATLNSQIMSISRAVAIVLLVAYAVYLVFNLHSHHSIFEEVLEQDVHLDEDKHKEAARAKLTTTECVVALLIALTCVSLIAVFLVLEIPEVVHSGTVSEAFMGLILVPLVEKVAEHLTALDEAWDNQINFAMGHVLGSTIQTALLNTPLAVIVGWALDKHMDLRFATFDAILVILSILVVGTFLRDGKSNYLEGALCVCVYVLIAISAFFYGRGLERPH